MLTAISGLKQVVKGERFKVTKLPLAVINPEEVPIEQGVIGTMLSCDVYFTVIVICRETEPEDWFADVISLMGDVMDAVLADRKLSSTVQDCIPVGFTPGEITIQGSLYYGGAIRFRALLHYTP